MSVKPFPGLAPNCGKFEVCISGGEAGFWTLN